MLVLAEGLTTIAPMTLEDAIHTLQTALRKEQPSSFSSMWVYSRLPRVYFYIWRNVRTELGEVDWDLVTSKLEKPYQRLWHPQRRRRNAPYRDDCEIRSALGEHWEKRYVFLHAPTEVEWRERDWIAAILSRLSQKGNVSAQEELLELLRFMVDSWMERRPDLRKWRVHPSDLDHTLKQCIRCYRYTGSFSIYLLITLMKAGRGLPYIRWPSLDATILDSDLRRIDSVVQDPETGELRMAELHAYHV